MCLFILFAVTTDKMTKKKPRFGAAVLRSFGPPEAEGTAKYCEMVDGFFDCLNVRSTTEHQRKRKPFLAPYHDSQDSRYDNDN